MSSAYETKFDLIYRKLQDRKLGLKKDFDGAYSRDDFQTSMTLMEEIQVVMQKLTSLEDIEKPFKQAANTVSRIEELKLEIEMNLEELGKEVKALDDVQDVLRHELQDEMSKLQELFREEESRNFEFEFEKFTDDELMTLVHYAKRFFPSRIKAYEQYWDRNVPGANGSCAEVAVSLDQALPVEEGPVQDTDLVLDTQEDEQELEEDQTVSEPQEAFDHGVEDLSDFSRQHKVHEPTDVETVPLLSEELSDQAESEVEFSEAPTVATESAVVSSEDREIPEGINFQAAQEQEITEEDVQAYEQEVDESQSAHQLEPASEYSAEEYVEIDFPDSGDADPGRSQEPGVSQEEEIPPVVSEEAIDPAYSEDEVDDGEYDQATQSTEYAEEADSAVYAEDDGEAEYVQETDSGEFAEEGAETEYVQEFDSGEYAEEGAETEYVQEADSGEYAEEGGEAEYTEEYAQEDDSGEYSSQEYSETQYAQEEESADYAQDHSEGDYSLEADAGEPLEDAEDQYSDELEVDLDEGALSMDEGDSIVDDSADEEIIDLDSVSVDEDSEALELDDISIDLEDLEIDDGSSLDSDGDDLAISLDDSEDSQAQDGDTEDSLEDVQIVLDDDD